MDYPDANNFTADVFGTGGAYSEVVDWDNTAYNDLIKQAALEADPAKRQQLYADAEAILVAEDAAIAPLFWYRSPRLIRPNVKYTVSVTGYDFYEKWDIE
jgi:oligopeptide transport system substrate-binding protein